MSEMERQTIVYILDELLQDAYNEDIDVDKIEDAVEHILSILDA